MPEPSDFVAPRGDRLRIFWWHPKAMDYRLGLFERICARHEVRFFFQWASLLAVPAPCAAAERPRPHVSLHPRGITRTDRALMREQIARSDVFVTSFLGNVFTAWGLVYARRYGVPVVVWEEMQKPPASVSARLKRRLYALLAPRVDAFFVLGRIQRDTLCRLGVDPDRVYVAGEAPGVDYGRIEARPPAVPFPVDAPVFLYVGRFVDFKGVDVLLDAFALVEAAHPTAALALVGDGADRAALEARARALGLRRVHFAGFVADPLDKAGWFARARALVVPSIRAAHRTEGGPLVVLEALSAGVPVIGTDAIGSSAERIRSGIDGEIVPERDPRALAAAMSRALAGPHDPRAVRAGFEASGGHELQASQLEAAIRHALRNRRGVAASAVPASS